MLKKSIDIISNKNTKISVPVHQGLLNANTNKKKLEKDAHCFQGVLNPYNLQRFNYYSRAISFAKDYKNGYAPIELQRKNNDDQNENYNESNAKNHFIRKKQSTLTLPRTCGVSYIRPSESHQDPPFDPLPPLVFQCSSACSNMKEERQKYQNQINVFINMAQKSWLAYIRSDENHMRNLLLGERIGTVGWVQGIQNIWPLLVDGNFLLLLFCKNLPITEEQVWSSLNTCSFKIGILCKKSTSGKKSFLKSVGIQASAQDDDKKNADNRNQNIENEEIQKEKKQSPVKENPLIKNRSNKKQQDENYVPQQEQEQSYQKLKRKRSQINSLSQDLKNELKDCRTVLTLSLRLQLYVTEKDWKQHYTNQDKNMLNLMINCLKEDLQKKSLSIIKQRFDLSKIKEKQSQMSKFLLKFKHPIDQVEKKSNDSQTMTVVGHKQIFSVETMNELFGQMKQNKLIQQVELLNKNTKTLTFDEMFSEQSTESAWEKYLKMPIYYISTRDSFAFDLIQKWTTLKRGDRQFNKIQYFFDANNLPTNFTGQYKKMFPNFNVGVTCYYNFFTNQELKYFEQNTFKTEEKAFKSSYLQMTVQPTITNTKVKRTKFFFGYRYMWTSCQLAESTSYVAAGVRKDVTQPPKWTKNIQNPMVEHGIVEKDFLNSIAINVYHDGKQGLAQHFDDAVRFKQPIYTLRLFSDARLSFGSQFYGFCNGAFIIPLPRGCICVMQQNSYAANGVKHCVRPCDMTGKSAAVILRQMHHQVIQQAAKYDQMIDFPAWMSTLLQRKYEKKDINKSLMKKQEKSKNSQDKEWKDIGQQNKKIKIKQNSDKRDELIAYTYAEQKKRVVEYLSNERSETILN